MPILQAYKDSLSSQRADIKANFLRFKNIRAFMGCYTYSAGKVFLTFSSTNNFGPTLKIGKALLAKICVFESTGDIDQQIDALLLA